MTTDVPASPAGGSADREGSTHELQILNEIARIATLDLDLQPMLQRITDTLHARFGCEFVDCAEVDLDRGVFVCRALSSSRPSEVYVGYSRKLGSGVVGHVALTGDPVLLDDVSTLPGYVEMMGGARSELCVPVHHGDRLVAVLNLESMKPGAFHGQLPLLKMVADQVAGAIASAKLYDELKRRAALLEALGEVTRLALEGGDLFDLLTRMVDAVQKRTALDVVAVLLRDDDGEAYHLAAHAGWPQDETGTHYPVDVGLVGRCLRTGEIQLVTDLADDGVASPRAARAELVVPIRFRGTVLGVFNAESTRVEAFDADAVRFFRTLADQIAGAIHLAATTERALEASRRLAELNEELQRLTIIDSLTGIGNRRRFDEVLELEWRRATRTGGEIALAMVDIDCFKAYNDRYGHPRGDTCLQRVAEALQESLNRAGDFLGRYGGEEFVAILPGAGAVHALRHAEALRRSVERLSIPHEDSTAAAVVTASVGVATMRPAKSDLAGELLRAADEALYRAKREGRNRVCVTDDATAATPA